MKKRIEFPALDLSFSDKNWINMEGIFFEEDYLYFNSEKKFKQNYLNHILVDSKGGLYQIIGKEDLSRWRKFIPNIKKSKILFKDLKDKMDLENIKKYYIKKIREYDVLDVEFHLYIEELVSRIKKTSTIEEFFKETC